MIERNAKRLESLANDILTVSRIEGNRLNLNKEPLELNEMIMHVISDSKTIVPAERKVDFIFESSKEPVLVDADKSKLLEVLLNLIRNAIKFTTETKEAKIDVTLGKMQCEPDGKGSATMPTAVISIKDNGRGIAPEIASRLFQKFASSTDRGGTGIGLYVSKSIIEAHGGKIWGENNKDGKGAAFSFTLPLRGNIQGNAPDEKIDIAGLKKA